MVLKECCEKYIKVIQPLGDMKSEVRICTCKTKFAVIYLDDGNKLIAVKGTILKKLSNAKPHKLSIRSFTALLN